MIETTYTMAVVQSEHTASQHTERAKLAAAVLAERGWSVTENDGVNCHKCGHDLLRYARYCYQCGEPARNITHGTLEDLELAIAAAVTGASSDNAHEQTAAAMAADNCEMWRTECDSLRTDAERYRWLRDQHNSAGLFSVAELGQGDWWLIEDVMGTPANDLDAAIDKALSERAEGGAA